MRAGASILGAGRPRQRPMETAPVRRVPSTTPPDVALWPPGPPPLVLPFLPPQRTAALLSPQLRPYSERCCGIPASRARTSVSLYRRWPPSVRIDVSLPALAQRVTVFGSTRNIVATSAGVRSGSASGVRADMCKASPPGPALRSCLGCSCLHWKPAVDVLYGLLEPYCHHQP